MFKALPRILKKIFWTKRLQRFRYASISFDVSPKHNSEAGTKLNHRSPRVPDGPDPWIRRAVSRCMRNSLEATSSGRDSHGMGFVHGGILTVFLHNCNTLYNIVGWTLKKKILQTQRVEGASIQGPRKRLTTQDAHMRPVRAMLYFHFYYYYFFYYYYYYYYHSYHHCRGQEDKGTRGLEDHRTRGPQDERTRRTRPASLIILFLGPLGRLFFPV